MASGLEDQCRPSRAEQYRAQQEANLQEAQEHNDMMHKELVELRQQVDGKPRAEESQATQAKLEGFRRDGMQQEVAVELAVVEADVARTAMGAQDREKREASLARTEAEIVAVER